LLNECRTRTKYSTVVPKVPKQDYFQIISRSHLFQASILVGGGSVINGAYPIWFLSLVRDWVTITSFSSILVVRTSPVLYQKAPPEMFKKIKYIFWFHLDIFIEVCRLLDQYKNY
jgi:hypothetical protein